MDAVEKGTEAHRRLQARRQTEFDRRVAERKSPAAVMAGWDDYCRVETAKVNARHPRWAARWVEIRVAHLVEAIAEARTLGDFKEILEAISQNLPLAGATSEAMQYALIPPTLKPPKVWPKLVRDIGVDRSSIDALLRGGFMPIRADAIPFFGEAVRSQEALVDADYGVATVRTASGIRTPGVDVEMAVRYSDTIPDLLESPQRILDIGARRGHEVLRGHASQHRGPISRPIRTRRQLDLVIERIRTSAEAEGLEVWLRGQPKEYLMPDLRELAERGLAPVRGAIDPSQVPSLYRGVNRRFEDLREYCSWLVEILRYYLFMRETLALPTAVGRHPDAPVQNLMAQSWVPPVEFTITRSIDGEVYEQADTNLGHGQMQAALFLQHYGIESNILDLTDDVDVALFFAQNRIEGGRYVPAEDGPPVIYVYLLDPRLDRVVRTADLLDGRDVLRPKRQRCGIVAGASLVSRNFYARFVGVRLVLTDVIDVDPQISAEYLFPSRAEDSLLDNFLELADELSLERARPFELAAPA